MTALFTAVVGLFSVMRGVAPKENEKEMSDNKRLKSLLGKFSKDSIILAEALADHLSTRVPPPAQTITTALLNDAVIAIGRDPESECSMRILSLSQRQDVEELEGRLTRRGLSQVRPIDFALSRFVSKLIDRRSLCEFHEYELVRAHLLRNHQALFEAGWFPGSMTSGVRLKLCELLLNNRLEIAGLAAVARLHGDDKIVSSALTVLETYDQGFPLLGMTRRGTVIVLKA